MLTQHYKIKATLDNVINCRPGQFVHEGDESSEIRGFIECVTVAEISIMLFKPIPLASYMTNIASECDTLLRFKEIMDSDPEMKEMWQEIIAKTKPK